MVKTKSEVEKDTKSVEIPSQVKAVFEQAGKMLGIAAKEGWIIFVRQYVVRGISEIFVGAVVLWVAWYLQPYIGLWWLLGVLAATPFFYGAIQLIGNPRYWAIEDIVDTTKNFKER